ncbi:TIGR03085 family metal-binding protein [Nocardioides sp. YIM 152315]|uniref:TIGR03085 family metal-binding protein n=1 Tax=Nocardioides sp. YIM 152315 TaxID=3031760 RepID=UPI0023DA2D94|nr:TIGR03085 family metal-binding protein [Nocardioides sp. YIM 152315]MDF1603100.1 TIGR03085 family metal-binding protein [Nocardioides sp. YIM 152315]
MTDSLARRERAALCDLALEVGPDAPTLCAGWAAEDLVVHLLVRERRPLAAAGIVLSPLAGLTERASRSLGRRPYADLVARLRSPGGLFVVPAVDDAANTLEYLVHHEDLRRGRPDWQPRALPAADADALWGRLARSASFLGRRLPVPTVLRRADTETGATIVARKGDDPVTISGDVVEVILFLFGRSAVVGIDLDGPEESVAALRAADLGA